MSCATTVCVLVSLLALAATASVPAGDDAARVENPHRREDGLAALGDIPHYQHDSPEAERRHARFVVQDKALQEHVNHAHAFEQQVRNADRGARLEGNRKLVPAAKAAQLTQWGHDLKHLEDDVRPVCADYHGALEAKEHEVHAVRREVETSQQLAETHPDQHNTPHQRAALLALERLQVLEGDAEELRRTAAACQEMRHMLDGAEQQILHMQHDDYHIYEPESNTEL
jgi:hypothetical protein